MTQDLSSSSKDASINPDQPSPPSPARSKSSSLVEGAPVVALKGKGDLIKQTKPEKKKAKLDAKEAKPAEKAEKSKKAKAEPPPPFSLRAAIAAQMKAAEDALALPNAAAAVHETRIALKRLRMLARIADYVTPQGGAALEVAAQTMMRHLGHARDLAALEHAAQAVADEARGASFTYLNRVAGDFARQRRVAEVSALNEAAIALVRLRPIAEAVPDATPSQVRRAARRLNERARTAFGRAEGRSRIWVRHDWRKREKDRRNATLIIGRNWPGKVRAGTARRLTEALGRERDALLLLDRLKSSPRTSKRVLRLIKKYRRDRARRADKLGARLHR